MLQGRYLNRFPELRSATQREFDWISFPLRSSQTILQAASASKQGKVTQNRSFAKMWCGFVDVVLSEIYSDSSDLGC